MSKTETKQFAVDDMIAAVVKGTDWAATWADDGDQYLVTFKRGELIEEVGLNKSRLDPKAGDSRTRWVELTRKSLATAVERQQAAPAEVEAAS